MTLTREQIIAFGYDYARQLPNGTWIALTQSLFTLDLCEGLDETGWRQKWMYEDRAAALTDFATWNGEGDPPGLWTKHKPSDRWHPSRAGEQSSAG
jgi:hypothetical protein